ncbi:MAG TPA: hypothetical protein VF483_04810 [Gemmatimonadaceae bacterium]
MKYLVAASLALFTACKESPTRIEVHAGAPPRTIRPQTVVLMVTPKIIKDFANPSASVAALFDRYAPFTAHAKETIVVFAVANSDHIIMYRGTSYWSDAIDWANLTDFVKSDDRILTIARVAGIVQAFKARADSLGLKVKIYDQIDSGTEFSVNIWKQIRHTECMDPKLYSFDIRGVLTADAYTYATAPNGTTAGTLCGTFLVDQAARYMSDLGFDGVLYGNQLGTRGRWVPTNGPGYSAAEAAAILDFFTYSRAKYGSRDLMWFDSYNNTSLERSVWSVPGEAYAKMSYILAAGFAVVTFPARYLDDLASKLAIPERPPVLASLDYYYDPWYDYSKLPIFPEESVMLEQAAINNRDRIDGIFLFANNHVGDLVPRSIIESFAQRFFVDGVDP